MASPSHGCLLWQRGFSLVELMITLVIGMLVTAVAGSMFLASRHANRTGRALGEVRESMHVAFERLAHDIRNAGSTGCGNRRVANVLSVGPVNGGTLRWADWRRAIRGFDGDDPDVVAGKAAGDRVPGQPSLQLLGGEDASFSIASHDDARAIFTLRETSTELVAKDVFVVCDYDHAAIFRSSSVSGRTVAHAAGDNCSTGLGYPTSCASPKRYAFGANALLTRLDVADWYVGVNPDKGLSLYRLGLEGGALKRQEMVRGVTDMQLTYHPGGRDTSFVRARDVTDWEQVTAVRATLTVQSSDLQAGVDNTPITRQFSMTATLRNRVP